MYARSVVFLMAFFCFGFTAEASPVRELELKSNVQSSGQPLELNHDEMRYLAHKDSLIIGTWGPDVSPLVYDSRPEYYRGVNADYLMLLQNNLHLRIIIRQYDNEHDAQAALMNNQVDTLLTPLFRREDVGNNLQRTSALIKTWPALVTSLKNAMLPLTSQEKVKLACARDCAFLNVISQAFPNAQITLYDNEYQAMTSVVNGDNQYFIGNNITSSHCISKYFSQSLVITHYFGKREQYNYFVTTENQALLRDILDRFVTSITNDTRIRVMQNWLNRGNLSYLYKPMPLSEQETRWLKKKKRIRVLINPDSPPYTLVDREGELRGIIGDVLNIVELQTGIEFEPVLVDSNSERLKQMHDGGWDLFPAIPLVNELPDNVTFSDPVMNISFVMVTAHEVTLESIQAKPQRIAIPARYLLQDALKARYPKATWVRVENASIAMSMVNDGTADAAITTELAARYMIDHYYPKNMHYIRVPDMPVATVSFAIAGHQPELMAVLDRALELIPPREILQMTERWSKITNVQIDTWDLYSKQFYQLVGFALVLIALSLCWGLSLSREVHKRRESQRLLEEQLHLKELLSCQLEAEKDKAIQATKAKSRFLASMSHELRTPVSSIVGFLELLSTASLNAAQRKEAIDLAASTAQSLLGLIGKILDVDKIESGKYQINPQWTDVSQLLNLPCHSFDALAKQKGISLRCVSYLAENIRIYIDLQAFRQVLTNLVGNALKFTDHGQIQVSARLTSHGDKRGSLEVSVSDTGCGISEADQTTLFHRYAQAEQGRQQTGSGLGLVICKELVTLMGGSLAMNSRPSQGTTFTITLPVETARQQALPAQDTSGDSAPLPRLSILIADDNPTNRLLLKHQLSTLGYSADEACDGEDAEARLEKKHYDLLITDVNMPKKDGLALAASLRERHARLQIWGLTADALSQSRDQCLNSGMNVCLFKPVSIQTLIHELHKLTVEHPESAITHHLQLSVLNQNTGGDPALINEILHTFREAATADLQTASEAVRTSNPRDFLHAMHRLHGSAQILDIVALQRICEPFESLRHDTLPMERCVAGLKEVTQVMREIEQEIERLLNQ